LLADLKPIVIIGAGGYGQELAWLIEDLNALQPEWNLLGFVDPINPNSRQHYGRPVLGGYEAIPAICPTPFFTCGIGKPAVRQKEATRAENLGWKPAVLIHPSVIRAHFVSVGKGTVVGPGTILAPHARIGKHCAINMQTSIGHDSSMGDFCVISPGARILGRVTLEDLVLVGANACVYPGRHVGAGATLAANSFLHTNLAAGRSAIGVPAKVFFTPKPGGSR
jgi:sugar O-acyltransferase (sialic acid O-acetyltransferase NeuD family)